ncbi:ABC-2 family transporter protein [Streptomyces sp. S4.7]|uniref:ABC transporter permease n=1 Tax=Streptomyces sp. S4.7 TaxID=2705439 RepID=UPI0013978027|nr:ABC transporter permease [Streptomyces sp. S4.7]QHY95791.1 ABC-2 family transporter protein [Streptomyces sp. S4.7]
MSAVRGGSGRRPAGHFLAVLSAEGLKLRTLRSTWWNLAAVVGLSVGIGYLYGSVIKGNYDDFGAKPEFDAVGFGFAGTNVAQLALVCFGVLAVGAEYSSGTVRASLTAVPRRGVFGAAKLTAVAVTAFAVTLPTAFVTFAVAQTAMGERQNASLGDPGSLRAVVGLAVYLTLLCLISAGVAMMLRSTVLALGILVPLFFIVSDILASLPGVGAVARYLPNVAGARILRVVPDDRIDVGAWGGLAVLLLWTAAALCGGLVTLRRRDA